MTGNIKFTDINADAIPDIIECYQELRPEWAPPIHTEANLNAHPSIGAYDEDDNLIAFIYCYYFAPDILEVGNLFVMQAYRENGIGSALLTKLEDAVKDTQFNALLLFNSSAYKTASTKKPAAAFYLKHGYAQIAETEQTKIFMKSL